DALIALLKRPSRLATKFIPLTVLEAEKVAVILKAGGRDGGLHIEADLARNGILVRGTVQQIQEIRDALGLLGEPSDPQAHKTRVITLDKGSAAALAEA